MDPKIAAGFSILGNALFPDPARLAQAELSRSAREENYANTRKLTLEADALKRAAENLARLQDVLSNPATTARDMLVPGIGTDIYGNDPNNLNQFALGAESLEGLDVNDPSSFSRALLGTGQVASQAATPSGFASSEAQDLVEKQLDLEGSSSRNAADIAGRTAEGDANRAAAVERALLDRKNQIEIAKIRAGGKGGKNTTTRSELIGFTGDLRGAVAKEYGLEYTNAEELEQVTRTLGPNEINKIMRLAEKQHPGNYGKQLQYALSLVTRTKKGKFKVSNGGFDDPDDDTSNVPDDAVADPPGTSGTTADGRAAHVNDDGVWVHDDDGTPVPMGSP